MSHLFQTAGTYDVTAQVGDDGPPAHITVIVQKPPLDLRQTTVDANGTVGLRVQLANPGTLTVGMVGVPGAHPMKQKMKRGTHTIQMTLPQSVRNRGVDPGQPDAHPRQRRHRPRQARRPAAPRLDRARQASRIATLFGNANWSGGGSSDGANHASSATSSAARGSPSPSVALVGEVERRVAPSP